MTPRSIVIALTLMMPSLAVAQAKTPTHFDVITVKPHKASASNMSGWRWTSVGIELTNVALDRMISVSGRVQPWLVFGVPSWATSSRWDISAKVTDPGMKPIETVTPPERMALIRSILTDRFGLVTQKETKVQPVFRMTVMPDGPKFRQSPPPPPGEPEPKFGRGSIMINNGVAEARNVTIYNFTDTLSALAERTVIDNTNLTGEWDLNLKWQPDDRTKSADDGSDADAPPSLIEAVKEQLGLKMTADKAPVPTVVVDKIVQPEAD